MAILTGSEILKQYQTNRIVIEPFEASKLNVKGNSYDVTLGDQIAILPTYHTIPTLRHWANQLRGLHVPGGDELTRQGRILDNAPCPVVIDPASPLHKPVLVAEVETDDEASDELCWFSPASGFAWPVFIMVPGVLYIAHTHEACGSDYYIPILHGKSSLARLGLSIHLTAGFGEAGFKYQWTLEMTCVHPIMLYPRMRIGQVEFETVEGTVETYEGNYKEQVGPVGSKMHRYFKDGKPI